MTQASLSAEYVDVTLSNRQLVVLVDRLKSSEAGHDKVDHQVRGLIVAFQSALDECRERAEKRDSRHELLKKAGL